MLDNLKVGTKMLLFSGSLLVLLLTTLVWAITGLSSTVSNGQEVSSGNTLRGELLQREVDHLNWVKQVSAFLTDEKQGELTVQLDHTQCGFGKWYYGEGRKQAEVLLPELREGLIAIEEPHIKLHASAQKIKSLFQKADPDLPRFLTEKELDHMGWVYKIQTAILSHDKGVKVQFDHTLCGFGKFLYGDAGLKAAAGSKALAKIIEEIKGPHQQLHEHGKQIDLLLSRGETIMAGDYFSTRAIPSLNQARRLLKAAAQEATNALQGQEQAQQVFASETQLQLGRVQESLRELIETASKGILSETEMIGAAQQTRTGVLSVGIFALFIGILMAFFITRSIKRPLQMTVNMIDSMEKGHIDKRLNLQRKDEIGQMAKAMDRFADNIKNEVIVPLQRLAQGDLSLEVQPRDDRDLLRMAIRQLGQDLTGIIQQIQLSSDQIASGSLQVSDASQQLSEGATQSAASLEEISSSMNVIAAQSTQSSENANQANILSSEAAKAATIGSERMTDMISAMSEINQSGENIRKIIKVIDEIAFQTNLLALNAAVEAARAGQHGKGFAVVAEEVRNLAARSAKAASETTELIEGSVEKATNGTQIAQRTAESLAEIVTSVTKVTDLVAEIATASREQANGISQINIGLQQIDQVIQQNTASAEESAATSEELSSQAAELKHQLARFTFKNSARGGHIARPASPSMRAPAAGQAIGWKDMTASSTSQSGGLSIEWNDSLCTGIKLIDNQHKRLIDLINQLVMCMKDGGDRMVLASVVDELVNYTVTHFRDEEEMMKKYNYPDFAAHKKLHDEFVAKVADFTGKLKAGDRLPPADIYRFLNSWLIGHIEKQDRDGYGPYIKQ